MNKPQYFRNGDQVPAYTPTPEQIRDACLAIRAERDAEKPKGNDEVDVQQGKVKSKAKKVLDSKAKKK